jgi:hypothetical protein
MDRYQVGNIVQVQGAIKLLSLLKQKMVQIDDANVYEGWLCFRELQIHSMHKVTTMDDETLHWLSCLQFQKRIGLVDKGIETGAGDKMNLQGKLMHVPVLNGLETLQSLPQDEQHFICSLIGGCCSEDHSPMISLFKDQYERLFAQYYGRNCKCELMYKDVLLYCHCLATKEPLDPHFVFRDALLMKLVEMEKDIVEKDDVRKDKEYDVDSFLNDDKPVKRLEFQYSVVFCDKQLNDLAKEIVSTTKDPGINLKRLFTNTFRHLRNDGVVYLLDDRTDSYLFMSKDNVLLPGIIQHEIENDQWNYQHKILKGTLASSSNISPPQLPEFLKRTLSSAKLRLLQRLAKRQRNACRDQMDR